MKKGKSSLHIQNELMCMTWYRHTGTKGHKVIGSTRENNHGMHASRGLKHFLGMENEHKK